MSSSPQKLAALTVSVLLASTTLVGCAGENGDQRVLEDYEEDAGDDEPDAGPVDARGDADEPDGGDDNDQQNDTVNGDNSDNNGDNSNNDNNDTTDNGDDGTCQPVGDGVVRRSEFTVATDVSVPYEFALDVQIDVTGEEIDGTRVWDLEEIDGDEFVEELQIHNPDDYWFGDEFPDADYAAKLSVREDELGVYRVTDDALLLLGLATLNGPDSEEDHTNIEYDPPIEALSFPLEEGKTWSTDIEADGEYAEYAAYTGHDESYDVEVDDAGEVVTPYGTFDVLRVYSIREHPTLKWGIWGPYMADVESRIVSFVAECFGTVARVLSEEDEEQKDFEQAAEVMRLTQ